MIEPAPGPHRSGSIALVGRPNAGKSTLLNRLVGAKLAIVSDKPQTTRTRIVGVKNAPGVQAMYLDTPGIHRPLHRLNVRMVDSAVQALHEADVVVLITDVTARPGHGERYVRDLVAGLSSPVVLVLNKVDLVDKPRLLPLMERHWREGIYREIVPVSARTGDNVARLEQILFGLLPEGEPLFPEDYLTDRPERFFVAETVREKVLELTRDELPFATAVLVDRFEEPDARGLMRLYCTILVERESQKPIVVGRGGELVKRIGTEARQELERFFGARVYLDLRVKVDAAWRENERVLDALGVERRRQ